MDARPSRAVTIHGDGRANRPRRQESEVLILLERAGAPDTSDNVSYVTVGLRTRAAGPSVHDASVRDRQVAGARQRDHRVGVDARHVDLDAEVAGEVERLHRGLRPDILFVLDSAYAEYVTATDYSAGIDLVDRAENVVMVRTFSKMGLAAERVGWMYGPAHVVDAVNRIRGPFNVSVSGQVAAAAAVRDTAFTAELRAHNARWRDWLTQSLASNRIHVPPSQGNFVLAVFEDSEVARAAFEALRAKGLLVREMHSYGIPQALRISIGLEAGMRGVVEVLKDFGARGAKD